MGATCRTCGAAIWWATTRHGERMPLDAEPDPRGRWLVVDGDGRPYETGLARAALEAGRATVAAVRPEDTTPVDARWVVHWATCPQAEQWRKRR